MAELLLKNMKRKGYRFYAGNKPAERVNPVVVDVLKESGINISANQPKLITAKMAMDFDLIVTMGCNDQGVCPGPFFKPTIEWHLEDPKGKPVEKVGKSETKLIAKSRSLLRD